MALLRPLPPRPDTAEPAPTGDQRTSSVGTSLFPISLSVQWPTHSRRVKGKPHIQMCNEQAVDIIRLSGASTYLDLWSSILAKIQAHCEIDPYATRSNGRTSSVIGEKWIATVKMSCKPTSANARDERAEPCWLSGANTMPSLFKIDVTEENWADCSTLIAQAQAGEGKGVEIAFQFFLLDQDLGPPKMDRICGDCAAAGGDGKARRARDKGDCEEHSSRSDCSKDDGSADKDDRAATGGGKRMPLPLRVIKRILFCG